MRLGERSGLTGRLVFPEQDGAGRSRTEQDGAGRSRTEQDGAGRSRTEQDGAGRSRTEQDGAANGRLRWAVSSLFICVCPTPEATTIPHARQPSSTRICGALRARSTARAPTLPATAPPRQRSRGSSRSRGALPTMFRPSTTKARSGTASRHHDAGPGSAQVPQNGVTPMGSITQHRAGHGEYPVRDRAQCAGMTVAASLADRADRTTDGVETLDQARLRRHPHGDACIDHQIVSGGVTALVAGQVQGSVRYVFGRTGTIQR